MKSDIIRKIYIVWRKAKHDRRIIVGEIIKRNDKYELKYLKKDINEAKKEGFVNYPDFPNLDKTYSENVMDVLARRLNDTDRSDINTYFDFWEINPKYKDDKFYILAQTQGLLSTDNFEFLASYYLKKDLSFISEIAGISKYNVGINELFVNDSLSWEYDSLNTYDSRAIMIFKGSKKMGYVKRVHNDVFHQKRAENLKIRVKSLERNGVINRALIVIYNES